MKAALDKEGLKPYLMLQALGYHAPDASHHKYGASELPEWPLAMEPRAITRWEARRYAREAYNAGVRYIGGCCGFEPHHIREIAEELAGERGKRPPGQDKNGEYGSSMKKASQPFLRERHGKGYWMNLPSVANISQAFET